MTEVSKKLNWPQTSQIPEERTRIFARKLIRVLDDLARDLKKYTGDEINNLILGVTDHGDLTGLDDIQDHLYAFLHDGSRAFTAYGPGFSNDDTLADADPFSAVSEYAIKAYVDALLAYILASPIGSIIYIWEDAEGEKFLQRLIPGIYGQVLVTGGPGQRPFWDWVWQSPGGMADTAFTLDFFVTSTVLTQKIAMAAASDQGDAAILSEFASSGGPDASWYESFDYGVASSQACTKVTMDHTSDQGDAAAGSEIVTSVA